MAAIESQYHLAPTMSMSPDDVYDSTGRIIGGDDYHPGYSVQIPNGARSKSPDRTYLPAPSGSHYKYDQAHHTWVMEADKSILYGSQHWDPEPSGTHTIYVPTTVNASVTNLTEVVSFTDGTPASQPPSSSSPTSSSIPATQTTSGSTLPTSASDTDTTKYRVYTSGDVTKHPPGGYPPAPSDQIYEYNGSTWVLTSMSALPAQYSLSPTMSMSDDDVYDSSGHLIAGDDYHPNYASQIPNHAISKSPDRTFLPPPSGSHYAYDQAKHSWYLEADSAVFGGTSWYPPASGLHEIYTFDSSNSSWVAVTYSDGSPA
jgi:phage baseplate assembly protein gpV